MQYTCSEAIEEIQFWDRTVELVAYVDIVHPIKTTGKSELFKFFLNNGNGKIIECVIWGERDISALKEKIYVNKIVHIDGALARVPSRPEFNKENVNFELQLHATTEVNVLGDHVPEEVEDILQIQEVELNDVIHHENVVIHGEFKIEVRINDFKNSLNFQKGSPVTAIGKIQTQGPRIFLQVDDESKIQSREGDPLPLLDVLLGYREMKRTNDGQMRREDVV